MGLPTGDADLADTEGSETEPEPEQPTEAREAAEDFEILAASSPPASSRYGQATREHSEVVTADSRIATPVESNADLGTTRKGEICNRDPGVGCDHGVEDGTVPDDDGPFLSRGCLERDTGWATDEESTEGVESTPSTSGGSSREQEVGERVPRAETLGSSESAGEQERAGVLGMPTSCTSRSSGENSSLDWNDSDDDFEAEREEGGEEVLTVVLPGTARSVHARGRGGRGYLGSRNKGRRGVQLFPPATASGGARQRLLAGDSSSEESSSSEETSSEEEVNSR